MSLKTHAQEILDIIERGFYVANGVEVSIQTQHQSSVAGSQLYTPDHLNSLRSQPPVGQLPRIDVVNGTTQKVAKEMAEEGDVALLNFASARNPGGGFLNGAKAQEEDLCRCSTLYATLVPHREYYDANRKQSSLLYTDYAIFCPNVPFFKTRGTGDFLEAPFLSSVINAPAPNTGPYLARSGDINLLEQCFERRWRNVFAIARDKKIKQLLLGAWGCGAFGGDPAMASQTANRALNDFGPAFEKIVFAIPGKGRQSLHNLETFAATFG